MENIDQRVTSFIAIDGDDIGVELTNYIVSNDTKGAQNYSENLTTYFKDMAKMMTDLGCQIVYCGGDSILAFSDDNIAKRLVTMISPIFPISIGIGKTAEIAYIALQLAKARGKSQVVAINDITANTIKVWKK